MAGLEQLEVHSKSYLVRWVTVPAGNTISWSLQPHKKSIHFGLFRHPISANGTPPNLPALRASTLEPLGANAPEADPGSSGAGRPTTMRRSSTTSKEGQTTVTEKLGKLGIKPVVSIGRCEADQVALGHYNIPQGGSGMYGLVFDNTYSKQTSKTITLVLMTYPTNAPPKSGHHIRTALQRKASGSTIVSPGLPPISDLDEDLPREATLARTLSTEPRSNGARSAGPDSGLGSSYYAGVLSKKRRKRGQGYAPRFFSLDFTSSTLSYYKNRNSSALRGAIPLSLAAIGANEEARQISIDSGTEVWLLKAHNQKDFKEWRAMLEKATQTSSVPIVAVDSNGIHRQPARSADEEDRAWNHVEGLVGRVAGITDAVRRLAKDADPKYSPAYTYTASGSAVRESSSNNATTPNFTEGDGAGDYFATDEASTSRRKFWQRSSSTSGRSPSNVMRRTMSTSKPSQSSIGAPSPPSSSLASTRRPPQSYAQRSDENVHERCMAVLHDLDAVVTQFSELIAESRQRRMPELSLSITRNSIDSSVSGDFFDAEDGISAPQILKIERDSEAETSPEFSVASEADDSESTSDNEGDLEYARIPRPGQPSLFPRKPKSLIPLPASQVRRRTTIPPSAVPPPSIISILRKNAGKDLSTLSMPVTTNEPLSLLQRQAEQMEYSELLDAATTATLDSGERLLHVTAFALSFLSINRVKERAIRKPFNPMLGETYELVREDKGFRFLAEKISHRPVRIASQAESKSWSYTQAPSPDQKFWGKSAEIITDGRARVALHATGDKYSWSLPTCALRNVIGPGEKYVEPVQNMTVVEESSRRKAVATFKSGGMFSGRSEEVTVHVYDAHGEVLPLTLIGKWTEYLTLRLPGNGAGREIWRVGGLVQPAPAMRYGMTSFAATLNEVTELEEGVLPPTDSRLRPDQRAYEDGDVEGAEKGKVRLEEAQRRRRKEMEGLGQGSGQGQGQGGVEGDAGGVKWEPRWFEEVGVEEGEEVWVLKGEGGGGVVGGKGYWDVREAVVGGKGKWDGVGNIFVMD